MKKIILFLLISTAVFAQGPIKLTSAVRDTLSASRDTLTIAPQSSGKAVFLTFATTTGTDSIFVDIKRGVANDTYYYFTANAVLDMSKDSVVASTTPIIVTTTPKTYMVLDPDVSAVRIRTVDVDVTTRFIAVLKNYGR